MSPRGLSIFKSPQGGWGILLNQPTLLSSNILDHMFALHTYRSYTQSNLYIRMQEAEAL